MSLRVFFLLLLELVGGLYLNRTKFESPIGLFRILYLTILPIVLFPVSVVSHFLYFLDIFLSPFFQP